MLFSVYAFPHARNTLCRRDQECPEASHNRLKIYNRTVPAVKEVPLSLFPCKHHTVVQLKTSYYFVHITPIAAGTSAHFLWKKRHGNFSGLQSRNPKPSNTDENMPNLFLQRNSTTCSQSRIGQNCSCSESKFTLSLSPSSHRILSSEPGMHHTNSYNTQCSSWKESHSNFLISQSRNTKPSPRREMTCLNFSFLYLQLHSRGGNPNWLILQ